MTDQIEIDEIAAEDLDKSQLLEIVEQMGNRLLNDYDNDLRHKALELALAHAELVAEFEGVTAAAIVETAQTFLAFLKGE